MTEYIASEAVDISACCKTCFNSEDLLIECDAIASNEVSIMDMLTALFPNILQTSDEECELPKSICITCKQHLEKAYDFQQQIIMYDDQLRKLLTKAEPVEKNTHAKEDQGVLYVISEEENIENHDDEKEEEEDFIKEIKVETEDQMYGFQEADIPLNDDDFEVADNAFANEENQILANLQFMMPRINDISPPEGSKLLYRGANRYYQCDRCENVYRPRKAIVRHLKNCNGMPTDTGELGEFTEKPTAKRKVKPREPAVKEERIFQCSECNKILKTAEILKNHMKRHDPDNLPFSCSCCSMRFLKIHNLERHMRSHTGEPESTCDICGKGFSSKTGADLHRRLHFNDLRFGCDQCGKRFNTRSNLICHYRTHTGERPYGCKYCEKRFSGSNDLAKHMRTLLGEFMYPCSLCEEKFRTKIEVRRHLLVHGQEQMQETETNFEQNENSQNSIEEEI